MKFEVHDRVCFSFKGIIREGTIIAIADETYCVYDEIEQIPYEKIEENWIMAKEGKLNLVGLSRVKGRLFGMFAVGNENYYKILASDLEPDFATGIPSNQALCLKAWATGIMITPAMMQEYINLDHPDGPIIHNPQYAAALLSFLKQGSDDLALVQLDQEVVEMLTASCLQVGLLPRDYLIYWMQTMVDEQYYQQRKGQGKAPDHMIESVVSM